MTTPTLEDLRDIPEAAWLWDGARARIVWANRAGIAYFGGASLFDLVDRPFDVLEPGVEQVVSLSRRLRRGQVDEALLHFPSAGATAPLECRCMVHALADGRPGLLVVARHSASARAEMAAEDIRAAFDLLPSAAVLVGRDGTIRHLNAAALLLLGAGQRASLAGLMGEAAAADELLSRLGAAGMVVMTRPLAVRIGPRDIKVTARRLERVGEASAFALLLLDDVTERRALELKLTGEERPPSEGSRPQAGAAAAGALSEADAAAFEKLGRTLEEGIRQAPVGGPAPTATPPAPAAAEPAAPPPPPRRKLQRIPDQVRLPLENRSEAVLVAKDGQLLFANPAAARLFGHETGEDVINDAKLQDRFGPLGQSLPPSEIAAEGGHSVQASVQMTVIPWLGGPARQFVLRKADGHRTERADLRIAPAPALQAVAEAAPQPAPAPRPPGRRRRSLLPSRRRSPSPPPR